MRPAGASAAGADGLAAEALRTGDPSLVVDAVIEYRRVLAQGPTRDERARIEQNLGAAMCLMGQQEADPVQAAAAFELARRHLETALLARTREDAPQAWALIQANLAIVHLSIHRLTGTPVEAMAGHIALDGAQEVFRQLGDASAMDWTASIRMHLLKAVDRRRTAR
jgi:hypothetical protein